MKKPFLLSVILLLAASCAQKNAPLSDTAVREAADAAVGWQLNAYPRMNDMREHKADGDLSWQNATFLFSMMEWAHYTGNAEMLRRGEQMADSNRYALSRAQRIYHADDLVIGSFYARVFDQTGDSAALRETYERLRYIVSHPAHPSLDLDYAHPETLERWSWCDALFMAPPVFAEYARLFGDNELLGYMDHEYWATADYLYCHEDSLFYRDSGYFDKREANGEKIFWGRGNAWVIAGLARLIPLLPETMRMPYERLFGEMAARLASLQQPDGSWHASLLDPASYPAPETSSTGLIAYALWWGINEGYLPEATYLPHAEAAWKALVKAQHKDGMLGYVQPIGADPREVTADMTEVYGAAAMALTAIQIQEHNRLAAGIGRIAEAEQLMGVSPLSVMGKKEASASGDMHDYMSLARYAWPDPSAPDGLPYIHRDGESNPELELFDRNPLGLTADRITALANAYKTTRNERYARKATELIRVWFLDEATRMNPNLRYAQVVKGQNEGRGRSMGTIDTYSFVDMLEVLPALESSEAFTEKDAKALKAWFGELLHWMLTDEQALEASALKNNISTAYDAQCIAFAHYAGDSESLQRIARSFREKRLLPQIAEDGSQPEELGRTLAYHYSAYNIRHMIDAGRIAAEARETVGGNDEIKAAVDYLLRYTGDKEAQEWPYQQISGMEEAQRLFSHDAMAFYEELAENSRTTLSEWEFRRGDSEVWEQVSLPHSCNAIDGQSEHYYRGDAYYCTTINAYVPLSLEAKGEGIRGYSLLFKQAAQRATVYVNGTEVCDHFGGYTPFTVDISPYLKDGDNEVLVRTNNEMDLTMAPVSSDFNKNNGLHGEVQWLESGNVWVNTRLSGYRGMLVSTPEVSGEKATVSVRTFLSAASSTTALVRAYLRAADGRIVAQARKQVAVEPVASSASSLAADLTMQIDNPHLWNGLTDPYRYTVDLIVEADERVYEHRTARIGIRKVEARNDGFYLNGKLYPLRGFSYHQDKFERASALTKEDLDRDFEIIRELGCNVLRLAHYPHSEYAFDLCDSLGILVQTEIPWVNECGGNKDAYDQERYGEHLMQAWEEMIRGHYNHPCIAFWGMWNELGGSHANRPQGDLDKAFLVRMTDALYAAGKQLDPCRLIGFADMGFGMSIPELKLGRNYDYWGSNKYMGWYQDQQRPDNCAGLGGFMDYIHKTWGPCAITEYGAGGSPYCHSSDPVNTTVPATGGARHDEEWFNTQHETSVRVIKERPWLLFTSAWVLCDFAVADRREGYITCTDGQTEGVDSMKLFINDKGIVSRDRALKKDAFYLYRAWWNPAPTVYISQRRYAVRPEKEITIRVYSNADELTLYQNGRAVQTMKSSGEPTGLIWEFSARPFETAADEFRAEGRYNDGRTASDEVRFGGAQ